MSCRSRTDGRGDLIVVLTTLSFTCRVIVFLLLSSSSSSSRCRPRKIYCRFCPYACWSGITGSEGVVLRRHGASFENRGKNPLLRSPRRKTKSARTLSVYHAEPCPIAAVLPVRQTVTKPTFSRPYVCVCVFDDKFNREHDPCAHIPSKRSGVVTARWCFVFTSRRSADEIFVSNQMLSSGRKHDGFYFHCYYYFFFCFLFSVSCSRCFRALTTVSYRFTPGGNRVSGFVLAEE